MSNTSKLTTGIFSNRSDDWKTPAELYRSLNREFNFGIDAAANSKNAQHKTYFSKKDNALDQNWSKYKNVFLNPPYSQNKEFLKKAFEESKKGATVVCLIPFRSDTQYYHDLVFNKASEVRLIKGRLKYNDEKSNSAPFPSAIIVYRQGKEKTKFSSVDKTGEQLLNGPDTVSHFRARIKAFELAINILLPKDDKKKNSPRELLKQGFIHPDIAGQMDSLINQNDFHDNTPLSFTEITSYSTWFAMHPEKICGTEQITTSLFFPIKVVGTEKEIVDTIHKSIEAIKQKVQPFRTTKKADNAFEFELKLLELELDISGLGLPFQIDQYNFEFIPKAKLNVVGKSTNHDWLKAAVKSWLLKNIRNEKFKNSHTGYSVLINDDAIGKWFSGKVGVMKMKAFTAIEDIIKVAIKIDEKPDKKERSDIKAFHYFVSVVSVEKATYPFLFTVKETKDNKFIYDNKFIPTKKRLLKTAPF